MNEMSKPKSEALASDEVVQAHVADELIDRPFDVVRFEDMTDEDVALQTNLVRAVLSRAKRV